VYNGVRKLIRGEKMTNYEAGDQISVTRNQGKREATVLAVIGDEVLIVRKSINSYGNSVSNQHLIY